MSTRLAEIIPRISILSRPHASRSKPMAVPRQIGRFQIVAVIGSGAFGTVYRAYDPVLEREVALKVPQAGIQENPQQLERFLREAKAAGKLRDPHIVPVYETGTDGT